MTIASSTRKAGPFTGDDASTVFAFSFKVFSASDLYVVKAVAATGVETVLTLTTDYTVTLNADQNNNPGGTVTLLSALASGYTLTLTSSLGYLQPTDLTNQGGFYPQVITTALDRLTILAQQLKERLDRAVVVPISSALTVDALTADLITLADDVANIDTVAGISADVSTVAGISTDVTTAAANITSISNFADIYYGPSATAPTTRKDGSALQEGDLYFDTATGLMRVRTAVSGWLDAQTPIPISITTQTFSGTGSQTAFTLSSAPAFLTALEVAISGAVKIPTTDYTLSGTTLTFTSAPTSGTNNIFCRWYSAYSGGVPNDGSVTAAKLAPGAVESVTNSRIGSTGPASCRNKIRNPRFCVNQRGVSGTVTLAAGAFGHDGWKGGAAGCTYIFSITQGRTNLIISAGSLVQTVDGNDLAARANTYTLSWGGTCQGKIGAGSYGASGVTGPATGGTNINVEFGPGTLYEPQFEIGTVASEFDCLPKWAEFLRCRRYLNIFSGADLEGGQSGLCNVAAYLSGKLYGVIHLPVEMRATPTITYSALADLRVYINGAASTPTVITLNMGVSDIVELAIDCTSLAGQAGFMRIINSGWLALSSEI